MTPWDRNRIIAERAHNEASGRSSAVMYLCILILVLFSFYFFDFGIASELVRAIVDMLLAISDVFTEGKREYVALVLFVVVAFYIVTQTIFISRAHGRYHYFNGDYDNDPNASPPKPPTH